MSQTVNPLELQVLALLSRVLEATDDPGGDPARVPRPLVLPVHPLDLRPQATPRPSKATPPRATPLAP